MWSRRDRMPRLLAAVLLCAAAVSAPVAAHASAPASASSGAVTCPTVPPSPAPTGALDMSATVIGPPSSESSPCLPGATGSSRSGATSSTQGSGSRSASSGVSTAPSSVSTVQAVTPSPSPAAGAVDLGGVVHVGGLVSEVRLTPNPFEGSTLLSFTVRNVSTTTFDATADFWMEGPFGNRLAQTDAVQLPQLKAGESRVVSADLSGAGQWGLVTAHATFRPPAEVGGTTLSPLTRDTTVLVFPWLVALLLLAAAGAVIVVQIVLRLRRSATEVELGAGAPA